MKKKRKMLVWSLIAVIILVCIFAGVIYSKNIQLKNEKANLQTNLEQWMVEKNLAVADMEQCRTDNDQVRLELSMLNEDISKIKKGCMVGNACMGHFPDIRWICNAQGDAVNNGDKICVCDSNCNLQVS